MPNMDGTEFCKKIKKDERTSHIPVILLTALSSKAHQMDGSKAGADDYIVKPFELDELLARMRAVVRRQAGRAEPGLEVDGVTLDPATRQVTLNGAPVVLSAREYAVLEALMMRPGAILSRAQLEDRLYGWGEELESNAISVYVHQLRRKLGVIQMRMRVVENRHPQTLDRSGIVRNLHLAGRTGVGTLVGIYS